MNNFWLEKLKESFNTEFSYNGVYDFDDMKLAITCSDFVDEAFQYGMCDFEDIIRLAEWVRLRWNAEFEDLGTIEQGYIQAYARRILDENMHEIFEIVKEKYE